VQVLYLGGKSYIKGFTVLADSLKYIDEDILVLFAGYYNLPYERKIRNFLKLIRNLFFRFNDYKCQVKLPLILNSSKAKMVGFMLDIPALLASVDILIFPAVVPHFARPIIEAGTMSKPVIASNICGMDEIVLNNITGILYNSMNPISLASAINTLAGDSAKMIELGRNSYERASMYYSAEINVRKTICLYNILDKKVYQNMM
jgi:glycosyltransferase involved in cell wall biosynthesis